MTNIATVLLIGAPIEDKHGENACRLAMAEALKRLGVEVSIVFKGDSAAWGPADAVVILPGAGAKATAWETALVVHHGLRRRPIYLWYHNRSFNRWKRSIGVLRRLFKVHELCGQRNQVESRPNAIFFPNGVTGSSYRADASKRLIYFSQLRRSKGVDVAYACWQRLKEKDPQWRLTIVGPQYDWQPPHPPPEGFEWIGPRWGDSKFEALAENAIMLLPSRYINETQPVVAIEAMSVGLPVIISNHNQIGQTIDGPAGIAGVIVDSVDDVDAYCAAAEKVFSDWQTHSQRGIDNHREVYSMKCFEKNVARIILGQTAKHYQTR